MSGGDTAEAMVRFFLAREQGERCCLQSHRDDLLNYIYLWITLTCDQCGRVEEFEDVSREVATGQDWAWPFAERAVVQARQGGWSVEYDAEGEPVVHCGACQSPVAPTAPPKNSS